MTDNTDSPRIGERRIITARELGMAQAATIIKRSTSVRAGPVRELMRHGQSTEAIFAQQYVRSSHQPGSVVARTRAIAATGMTDSGVALSAVYTAEFSAAFSAQAETLRFGTNSIFLKRGESTDVFGYVGPWHLSERRSFGQAQFEEVRASQVDAATLMSVRDWMRGTDLVWFKLPSRKAAQAAEEIGLKLEALRQDEESILKAYLAGAEPDPRLLRRREMLKVGLEGYGLFVGFQRGIEIEREPSVEAILAAKGETGSVLIDVE